MMQKELVSLVGGWCHQEEVSMKTRQFWSQHRCQQPGLNPGQSWGQCVPLPAMAPAAPTPSPLHQSRLITATGAASYCSSLEVTNSPGHEYHTNHQRNSLSEGSTMENN